MLSSIEASSCLNTDLFCQDLLTSIDCSILDFRYGCILIHPFSLCFALCYSSYSILPSFVNVEFFSLRSPTTPFVEALRYCTTMFSFKLVFILPPFYIIQSIVTPQYTHSSAVFSFFFCYSLAQRNNQLINNKTERIAR